jgi:predicted nuclease of predicted toxin-antitoxin system
MSISILIDMNLSPAWVKILSQLGNTAVHWSMVGDPRATDREIMDWARSNGYVVFTHDLDFGTILALTLAQGPSVLQLRTNNVLPDHVSDVVVAALQQHATDLAAGAIVVIDESNSRVRLLPIK